AFVLVTGTLLYLTLRTQLRRWNAEFEGRKKAEEELRQNQEALKSSEERFQLAMQGANDGVWDWNLKTGAVYLSPRWKSMPGYSDDELANSYDTFKALVHPDDLARVENAIHEFFEGRAANFEIEFRIRHKQGHYLDILSRACVLRDGNGKPLRFVGTHVDITERKKAEEAIRASEERFRSFIELAPLAVFVVNREGVYIDMNPEAGKMLGYDQSELLGKRVGDVSAGEDRPSVLSSFTKLLAVGRVEDEYRMVRKDGEKIWVSIVAVPLDKNRILAYCRDVTPRRFAEEKLKASLREKEVLLKEVHHRVKNNLQVVSSLISLQAEELKDAEARAALRESRQRVRSMALIHESLYRSENLASIRFKEYIDTVVKELRRSYDKAGVSISVDVEPILLEIGSAVPCGLIINEILTNALKHAFPGGRQGSVFLRMRRSGASRIELVVEDNGVGFPEGIDYRKVTSMGMTLVMSLAQQLDADIRMENTGGTKYTVEFPG
ncbi:MAG: PAS domain S-box protein, partial [Bacteroidota bacterium]